MPNLCSVKVYLEDTFICGQSLGHLINSVQSWHCKVSCTALVKCDIMVQPPAPENELNNIIYSLHCAVQIIHEFFRVRKHLPYGSKYQRALPLTAGSGLFYGTDNSDLE